MKYLILFVIIIYQRLFPKKWRGKCLYHESCSNHVYRITKEQGTKAGYSAFKSRLKNCRPGYIMSKHNGKSILITVNNEVIPNSELDNRIKKP